MIVVGIGRHTDEGELRRIAGKDGKVFYVEEFKDLMTLDMLDGVVKAACVKGMFRSSNQSINQSINQFMNQSINQSINQYINQSINQSINQPIYQPINQIFNIKLSISFRCTATRWPR